MKKIFLIFFLIFSLFSCSRNPENTEKIVKNPDIVVLPHHGITGKNIDEFYKNLALKNEKYERIVIISPDHFARISATIESAPKNLQKSCFQDFCVPLAENPLYSPEKSRIFGENGKISEHGLGEHFIRISKNFPNIPVVLIVVAREAKISSISERLAENLTNFSKNFHTLFIISVDFSHHVREDIAIFHDTKSVQVLNFGEKNDFNDLEVDCRNCLFVAREIAKNFSKNFFHFTKRTSVDTILGGFSDTENTSHIFGQFSDIDSTIEPKKVWFIFHENDLENKDFFANFFQEKDFKKSQKHFIHHIATGFDKIFMIENSQKSLQIPFENLQKISKNSETIFENMKIITSDEKISVFLGEKSENFYLQKGEILACESHMEDFSCEKIAL